MSVAEDLTIRVPKVSLAELLEVRTDGLGISELLAILSSSCMCLSTIKNIESRENLFSPEHIFLTRNGKVEVSD